VLEEYLNKVLLTDDLWKAGANEDLLGFFQIPSSIREDISTPTYTVDDIAIYDADGNQIKGKEKDDKDLKKASQIAGAAAGFFMGGPVGAGLGWMIAASTSERDDTLGDLTRTAGKATKVALKQVQRLNERYDLTERGKQILKKGFDNVKTVIDNAADEK
jgi:hypothetical protein